MAERQESILGSLYKGTNPIQVDCAIRSLLIPRAPSPHTITLWIKISTCEFGGVHKHSVYSNSTQARIWRTGRNTTFYMLPSTIRATYCPEHFRLPCQVKFEVYSMYEDECVLSSLTLLDGRHPGGLIYFSVGQCVDFALLL